MHQKRIDPVGQNIGVEQKILRSCKHSQMLDIKRLQPQLVAVFPMGKVFQLVS
jgi:hypothetical protein